MGVLPQVGPPPVRGPLAKRHPLRDGSGMVATTVLRTACVIVLTVLLPRPASGQLDRAAVGTLLGAASGAYLSLALTTAAARAGHFAYSPRQAIWRLTPLPVVAAAGGVLGYRSGDRLRDAVGRGLVGFAAGTAVGALVGNLAWDGTEGVWSGAVIGSGAGLLIGSVWGAFRGGTDVDRSVPILAGLTLTIPFAP